MPRMESSLASELINVGIVKTAFEVTASRDTASTRGDGYRGTITTKTETPLQLIIAR